jgi:hypothetical protein
MYRGPPLSPCRRSADNAAAVGVANRNLRDEASEGVKNEVRVRVWSLAGLSLSRTKVTACE